MTALLCCLFLHAAVAAAPWRAPVGAPASAKELQPPHEREPVDRRYGERIEVRLVTVAVRVLDPKGRALRGLGPADFEVRVGGEQARIESVDWVGAARSPGEAVASRADGGSDAPAAEREIEPPGAERLVVVFVQTDLEPSRVRGHLHLLPDLRRMVAALAAGDRIAVVSFDSQLRLRQDFTSDTLLLDDALERAVRLARASPIEPAGPRSLGRYLEPRKARRAANPERALGVVAEALEAFPGEKVLILVGWGLGRYTAGKVLMRHDYDDARDALERARVTVFALDVTQADYHSLEAGLETVAYDTGGTYAKTFLWPAVALERLARTLEGHYEIAFAPPPDAEAGARVKVELVGQRGWVLARPTRLDG